MPTGPSNYRGYRAFRAALVAALALTGCRSGGAPAYLTAEADTGDVREQVTATGQVSARTRVNVGSQVSGVMRRVCVDFGQTVRRGELLAELDPRSYAAQLARAEASVQVAEANVAQARVDERNTRRTRTRMEQMRAAHLAAEAELDAAEAACDRAEAGLAGAQAGLVQARADAALARANVGYTRIESPIDGVVLERRVDVGQTVAAQLQVATLFVIAADLRRVQLLVNVDEADVGKLRPPQSASFRVPAYPQRRFEGTLVALRPAPDGDASGTQPTTAAAVVTYGAVIDADNADGALRQGMTAEMTAVVAEADGVVRVPSAAVRFRPKPDGKAGAAKASGPGAVDPAPAANANAPGDAAATAAASPASAEPPASAPASGGIPGEVYVLEAGRPRARAVVLGLTDGQYVAINAGLRAGERVVVGEAPEKAGPGGTRR